MTETLDLLATRRSTPPQMIGAPGPDPDQLDRLLTLASRVPDHGKLCRWRFIVFEGEGLARANAITTGVFSADNPGAPPKVLEWGKFATAPLVVAVVGRPGPHAKIPEWEQVLSLGAVCMTLSIAAQAMGFATNWLTGWAAYDRRVLEAFGVGPEEKIAGFVHIGASDARPADRERPVMAEIVVRF